MLFQYPFVQVVTGIQVASIRTAMPILRVVVHCVKGDTCFNFHVKKILVRFCGPSLTENLSHYTVGLNFVCYNIIPGVFIISVFIYANAILPSCRIIRVSLFHFDVEFQGSFILGP